MDSLKEKVGKKPIYLGLSSGYDSRAIFSIVRETDIPILIYNYGMEGQLDFDFVHLLAGKENFDCQFIDTSKLQWSLKEYEKNIHSFQDYPLSPRVVVDRILKKQCPARFEIQGYLNGNITGQGAYAQSENWEAAIAKFCKRNDRFSLQEILGRKAARSLLPPTPLIAPTILQFDRQLELGYRLRQRIRPISNKTTAYILPFEDSRWVGFWLERPFTDIRGQRLYLSFLKDLRNGIFFDLASSKTMNSRAMRQHRIGLVYGTRYYQNFRSLASKLGLTSKSKLPNNPTHQVPMLVHYRNNQNFRTMIQKSTSRLEGRNIFDPAFIEGVLAEVEKGNESAGSKLRGLVTTDILLETGIL
jgi:hypothetical protein